MKCSRDNCNEDAVAHWPAFDRKIEPKPYCAACLEQVKRTVVLEGPHLVSMVKRKRELVTV